MDMVLAAVAVVGLIYGWVWAVLWAVREDRRSRPNPEWMRALDAELERDLKVYLHPSSLAREDEGGSG